MIPQSIKSKLSQSQIINLNFLADSNKPEDIFSFRVQCKELGANNDDLYSTLQLETPLPMLSKDCDSFSLNLSSYKHTRYNQTLYCSEEFCVLSLFAGLVSMETIFTPKTIPVILKAVLDRYSKHGDWNDIQLPLLSMNISKEQDLLHFCLTKLSMQLEYNIFYNSLFIHPEFYQSRFEIEFESILKGIEEYYNLWA